MKTSARNRFEGIVHQVRGGAVNDEIELETPGGVRLVATVTRESRTQLGLEPGAAAFALVKASSVVLMTDIDDVMLSARNQLAGRVASVVPDSVNSEVAIDLAGGGQLVAIVTRASAEALGLAAGGAVTALFKASSVIVGVRRPGAQSL